MIYNLSLFALLNTFDFLPQHSDRRCAPIIIGIFTQREWCAIFFFHPIPDLLLCIKDLSRDVYTSTFSFGAAETFVFWRAGDTGKTLYRPWFISFNISSLQTIPVADDKPMRIRHLRLFNLLQIYLSVRTISYCSPSDNRYIFNYYVHNNFLLFHYY